MWAEIARRGGATRSTRLEALMFSRTPRRIATGALSISALLLSACSAQGMRAASLWATTPHYLRLRTPSRDTVLFPAVAYPTYEMGAILAGCRPIAVPSRAES